MSKFHSTVTRREFMKGFGLAGAGLGAAAAAAPMFHDLDELISAPQAGLYKHPWWAKEVDQPTAEIDWSQVERSDKKINGHLGVGYEPRQFSPSADKYLSPHRPMIVENMKERHPTWKGDTLRDSALSLGVRAVSRTPTEFLCPKKALPPEELGLPRWQGTPEDNYRMIRIVFRYLGASHVGVVELDQNTRKLFYARSRSQDYVFEDVDEAYEEETKKVIPNKCKYVIVAFFTAATETMIRCASLQGDSAIRVLSQQKAFANAVVQEFLYGLGYQGLIVDGLTNSAPLTMLSGGGEHSRMGFNVVSPVTGGMARHIGRIVTDFPLAVTKPVDGGVNRFCYTCKICGSEACPFEAIPLDDPDWDHTRVPGSPPGFKGWRMIVKNCSHCASSCQAICPFNGLPRSWIHEFVKSTVSTTSIFNSFFAGMEKTLGYGMKEPESFWEIDNLPIFGYDTRVLER